MKKSRRESVRKLTGKKSEMAKLEAWRRSLEKPYSDSVPVIEILLHIPSSRFRSYQWPVSPTLEIGSSGNSRKATAIKSRSEEAKLNGKCRNVS